LKETNESHVVSSALLGIPDEEFVPCRAGRQVITKSEVRAISLSQLGLHYDSVLWDIGSGTGSVAIEAAHLAHAGRVFAIEDDSRSLQALEQNCQRFGADNVTIVAQRAPAALIELPDPEAVFIGGSGGELAQILAVSMTRLRPDGRIVINLASLEHLTEAMHILQRAQWITACTLVSIARSKDLLDLTRFAALNPVFVVTARRPLVSRDETQMSGTP
jgi:precorrin-6B C5,15-methyltransferase / cobalt-precorrin-6B C5,C15-methyltransferase